MSRAFLEGLDASGLCDLRAGGSDRPLPQLCTKDIVFGEEKLAANVIVPAKLEAFRKELALSAREAVAIARAERDQTASDAAAKPARTPKRSAAAEELFGIARTLTARIDAWMRGLPKEKARGIWRADAWAARNRENFPLLNDRKQKRTLAYLDSAATTQRCFCALHAETTFYEHENANVYRGGYELSAHATAYLNDARKVFEDFIGTDRRQTIYTMNSFSLPNVPPAQIGTGCGMFGVAVRSGGHCAMPIAASAGVVGTGRASFAVHTTCEDIEALAVAVEMCRRLYR